MANKVTGSTDTTGALSIIPQASKSVLVVGKVNGETTSQPGDKKLFSIAGTADATAIFGANSIIPKIVRILILNGVDNIKGIIVPTASGAGGTELADTLEVSLQDKTIKCIITEDNAQTTISAVKDHLVVAESNDLFRYAVFSPSEADNANQDKLIAFAKKISSDRIFIQPLLTMDGKLADPQVSAAGLTSAIMTETDDPALPMNGVGMLGFDGVGRLMLDAEMKALGNGGVTSVYEDGITPTIYRLVTSIQDDLVWQEGSTRFIADYVLEKVQTMLRSNYKRTKNITRILKAVRDDIKVTLEGIEALEIIENFDESTLTVIKDPGDLYGALVDYTFDVVTPLYTIKINQHMKL